MKLLTARKTLHFCDPVAFGPFCWETKDKAAWCDHKGNQQIWMKYARSRAVICFLGIPLYTKRMQDTFIHWYKWWDLPPLHLPPSKTKEPAQYLCRLKSKKDGESPFTPPGY